MSCTPPCRLSNRTVWTRLPQLLRILDHSTSNPILDSATRIGHRHLCQYNRRYISGNAVETHKRGVSYQLEDGIVVVHFTQRGFCFLIAFLYSFGWEAILPLQCSVVDDCLFNSVAYIAVLWSVEVDGA